MTPQHFAEFDRCYGDDPDGNGKREDLRGEGRFQWFSLAAIKERGYKLDIT